jgi:TRAP-type mannitol/chloroaromatic compound transport system permease small subunit
MERYIHFADTVSAWFGKAFAWLILVMAFGVGYEVFVRYMLNARPPGRST